MEVTLYSQIKEMERKSTKAEAILHAQTENLRNENKKQRITAKKPKGPLVVKSSS